MQWWPIFQPLDGNDRYRDRQIAADRSVIHMLYKHQTVYIYILYIYILEMFFG